jgi:putative hemolysin
MNFPMPSQIISHYQFSSKKFIDINEDRYIVKLAENMAEVDAALKLRFEVFNLELHQGLSSSYITLRDEDPFDKQCNHLIVIDKATGIVVGTYRMQTFEMARSGHGFYSATEFEINKLGWFVLMRSVELGRACISKEHRNGRLLFLLWKGIGQYIQIMQKRFLFGCCSLNSQSSMVGSILMNRLKHDGHVFKKVPVTPRPGYECYMYKLNKDFRYTNNMPPLMDMYIRYGAKICSYPAIDREFKTIDYLALLDTHEMEETIKKILL